MESHGIAGKVALVTGAAQGIGEAVARCLAASGVQVAAADVNAELLDDLADDLRRRGHRAAAYVMDVRDSVAVETVVKHVEHDMGPIAILVNVAGVLRTGQLLEFSDDDWSSIFDVNVNGVFNCSRAVGRQMVPRGSGAIITVASNAACVPRMHMGAYAASKAASSMFTKCLGLELGRHGIRCNVVSPGSTETPMLLGMWNDENGRAQSIEGCLETFRVGVPLGKLARPEDIAEAVAFLASSKASHITMHSLCVDGGAALGA